MTATLNDSGGAPAAAASPVLGVLGGGQLGRMFVHAAQAMGFATIVLDPDPASPAGGVSQCHLKAEYGDAAALEQLGRRCVAVTTEFENVPAAVLEELARRCRVTPSASAVAACQHRAREKAHFERCGVPCAPYAVIESEDDVEAVVAELLPGILKTATLGYDGKGQVSVASIEELRTAWQQLRRSPCVLEKRVDLAAEFSVIVARAADGTVVNLPVQENVHRDGILALTRVPSTAITPSTAAAAIRHAEAIAASLDYVGVLCVEFFVLRDGSLLANEMAPRPHNSGHYSIDACDISQFELQVRATAGLPLVRPRQHSAALMLNLLGDLWFTRGAAAVEPPWREVLALPGVHLHLYGKSDARKGRKMGHLTVTAADPDGALEVARAAARILGLPAP